MPNFLKALIIFSLWAALALTSHFLLSKYQPDFCNHLKHSNSELIKINSGTKYFMLSSINDTISHYQSQNIIFENNQHTQKNIDSINFINDLIEKLRNDYRLQLQINYPSSFNSVTNENNFISEVESKFKNESINPEILKFSSGNNSKNTIDFKLLEKSKQLIDSIEQSITSKTLYVEFENGVVKESKDLTSYSNLLNQFLKNYSEKTISITGHTNNIGYFENNLEKGLMMANSLKNYLIKNENFTSEIKTYSRGEAEPIADKYTEKGKLLNQRIEIKIY